LLHVVWVLHGSLEISLCNAMMMVAMVRERLVLKWLEGLRVLVHLLSYGWSP
jgi:hypothetical protein